MCCGLRENKPTNGLDSQDRYKGIIRMANDGIVVIQDNKIAMVNPAFARILGYQQGELIGMEFETLLDPVTSHMYQEEYEKFDLDVTQKHAYRLRMLTKTGKALITEMSTANFAYEGCPAVVGIVRDMTKHLKLEAAIERSEAKYRQLYQSSPIAYFTLSPRGIVLQVNRAAMELLGYTEEAMIRRSIESFLPTDPEAFKAGSAVVSGLLDGGSVTGIEMLMRKADGKPIWVRVTAGPIERGEGARRIGFMAQDIDRAKLAEQRERLEAERANLLLEVATHDLNSINQAILFAMGLMESQLEIPENLVSIIREGTWNVRRSARMIANMRAIISLRDNPPPKVKTDLHKYLEAALQSVRDDFAWKNITLNSNIGEGEFLVRGHDYLEQVLFNIIHNSVMYWEGDDVEVDVMAQAIDANRLIRIEFSDRGPGIPDQLKEFIFKRTGSPDAQVVGRGLGLTLVDNIVRNLGGEIWVEDRIEGDHTQGTKFVCLLPAWRDLSELPCGEEACIKFYRSHHCFWCEPVYDLLRRMMEEMSIAESVLQSINVDDPGVEIREQDLPELPYIKLCDVELSGYVQEHRLRKELVSMLAKPCYKEL